MTDVKPLYVDSKAGLRSIAVIELLLAEGQFSERVALAASMIPKDGSAYAGDGSFATPFVTLEEARKVQKPGQPIIIAGYATISSASADYVNGA